MPKQRYQKNEELTQIVKLQWYDKKLGLILSDPWMVWRLVDFLSIGF